MKKIGLMGGTFDPIHHGHLLLAEAARETFSLDKVIFIPTGANPFKEKSDPLDRVHRYKMVQLATQSNQYFDVSTIELDRPGTTYTIDTIEKIAGKEKDTDFYFITGADVILEITKWKNYQELFSKVFFITAFRPGYPHQKLDEEIAFLQKKYNARIYKLYTEEMEIASSVIRKRCSEGQSVRYFLPDNVIEYMDDHRLYKTIGQTKMLEFEQIQKKLKKNLKPKRYRHTLGVVESAAKLAEYYGENIEKARYAALLHDCAKNFSDKDLIRVAKEANLELDPIIMEEPQLLHGPVGAVIAKQEYGIKDHEVLNAIAYHTTGRPYMSNLEKIIYLADFVEPGRDYPSVDALREHAYKGLNGAMIFALTNTIRYIASINGYIHGRTVDARNYFIMEEKKNTK